MRIAIIFGGTNLEEQRHNPVFAEAIEIMRLRGASVDLLNPRLLNVRLSDLRIEHDFYVIKSISNPMAATVAATYHALGALTFNPYPIVELIRNKVATLRQISEAGVPVPETYVTGEAEQLLPHLDEGPLIVKPYKGSRGIGVVRVTRPEELLSAAAGPPYLAQRFHPSDDGTDHKISMIGDEVFGVRRMFPIKVYADKAGTPLEIDEETREIANRISGALGIDTFSFDVIVSKGKPYVVDVSSFGSMMGVPNAPELIAARIIRAWEEREKS